MSITYVLGRLQRFLGRFVNALKSIAPEFFMSRHTMNEPQVPKESIDKRDIITIIYGDGSFILEPSEPIIL
jgi:hypothetical protein